MNTVVNQPQMDTVVSHYLSSGWNMQSSTSTQIILRKSFNHGIHLFISVMTFGLWLPIYFLLWAATDRKVVVFNLEEVEQ